MSRFDECLTFVLKWEGGRVDDPSDHGGRTAYGVTQATYDRYRAKRGLPARDVWQIERQEVKDVYLEGYWMTTSCACYSAPVDLVVFDSAVNCGPKSAVKWLQLALGMGVGEVDGIVGPNTLQHATEVFQSGNQLRVAREVCELRQVRYEALAGADKSQQKFLKGWLNRLEDLRKEAGL